jgi:hypothetical protein
MVFFRRVTPTVGKGLLYRLRTGNLQFVVNHFVQTSLDLLMGSVLDNNYIYMFQIQKQIDLYIKRERVLSSETVIYFSI